MSYPFFSEVDATLVGSFAITSILCKVLRNSRSLALCHHSRKVADFTAMIMHASCPRTCYVWLRFLILEQGRFLHPSPTHASMPLCVCCVGVRTEEQKEERRKEATHELVTFFPGKLSVAIVSL